MAGKQHSFEEIRDLFLQRESSYTKGLSGQARHELLFESYNVSPTEYRVLALLWFNSDGLEPSVLADTLAVLRPTMTNLIDSLATKKYVVRTEHPTDRRRVSVKLLPAGEQLARELLAVETEYTDMVKSYFSEEEINTYYTLFRKMQDARDAALKIILERGATENH